MTNIERRKKQRISSLFSLDFSELGTLPPTCKVEYPNKDDLLHFTLTIIPDDVNISSFQSLP